jgi:hypothetical protein
MPAFFKGVAMAIEQATLQAFKLAKELSDKLKVVRPQIEKRLDELINKLAKAADDLDEQNIKLYLKALDGEKHLLTKAMASVTVATANIEQVEDDEDFLNTRLKELEAVSKAVKEAKNSFDQRYATAMAIEKMARDAAKKAGSENTKLTERLASVDKLIADVEKLAVPASKKAQLIERWAGEAVEAHDAKGLEKQQSDMDALDVPGIISDFNNAKENNDWAVRSVKEATLEAGQRREMIDDLKDFADRLKALASITDDLDDRQKSVAAMKLGKVDVSKAAKVLSIDKKGETQLAKILGGPSDKWAVGLDGLAKQLGMNVRGKDMVQKLGKAGIA